MEKILDLITDQRFPWFYPWHLWRSINAHKQKSIDHPLTVATTFDIEEDYPSKHVETAPLFLEKVTPILHLNNVRATFLVQGSILPQIAKYLQILNRQGHEIGVHSLNHDNWGKKVWFLKDEPLTYKQKEKDLRKIKQLFRKYHLPQPKSFRCPNMNCRPDTLTLLEKYQYKVDSSWDSHRRPSNHIFRLDNLWEIPVSSLPTSKPQVRFGLPFTVFRPFNLANFLTMKGNDLKEYIEVVQSPLVFLAHPWEFFSSTKFSYCSSNNYQRLEELITKLQTEKYKFVTLFQMAKSYGRS